MSADRRIRAAFTWVGVCALAALAPCGCGQSGGGGGGGTADAVAAPATAEQTKKVGTVDMKRILAESQESKDLNLKAFMEAPTTQPGSPEQQKLFNAHPAGPTLESDLTRLELGAAAGPASKVKTAGSMFDSPKTAEERAAEYKNEIAMLRQLQQNAAADRAAGRQPPPTALLIPRNGSAPIPVTRGTYGLDPVNTFSLRVQQAVKDVAREEKVGTVVIRDAKTRKTRLLDATSLAPVGGAPRVATASSLLGSAAASQPDVLELGPDSDLTDKVIAKMNADYSKAKGQTR